MQELIAKKTVSVHQKQSRFKLQKLINFRMNFLINFENTKYINKLF